MSSSLSPISPSTMPPDPEDRLRVMASLTEVVEGEAFRGSRRSAQFLRHIVEHALNGEIELLKERMIGVALFNRPVDYDTGEDAIVRVTASDVRRRLAQHARSTPPPGVRITLPLGTYVPEFEIDRQEQPQPLLTLPPTTEPEQLSLVERQEPKTEPPPARSTPRPLSLLLTAAATFALGLVAMYFAAPYLRSPSRARQVLPWSVLLRSPQPIHIILADPDIEEIEAMTEAPLSASDYANHRFIPPGFHPTPEQQQLLTTTFGGDGADTVDSGIAASLSALAAQNDRTVRVAGARSIQLSELRSDDNFVLLGSPLSNPWVGLFSDQLDFVFTFNPTTRSEDILNRHPLAGERSVYHPTLNGQELGFGRRNRNLIGEAFALIAFVRNPDHSGHILLLAGTNREGTSAAGRLIASPEQLRPILDSCGLDRSRPDPGFEILLTLRTIAGTSSHVNAIACHPLRQS